MSEVHEISTALSHWAGFRLQKIDSGQDWLNFRFYGEGRDHDLLFHFPPACPVLILDPPRHDLKKKTIPLLLFLKAHFAQHFLVSALQPEGKGRILNLAFSNGGEIELRLFPHGQNLVAKAFDKRMSLFKVIELPTQTEKFQADEKGRSLEAIRQEWAARVTTKSESRREPLSKEKQLEKKRRALSVVEKEIDLKREDASSAVGEWIKSHQSLEVPAAWSTLVNRQESLAQNLNRLFSQGKSNLEKLKSAEFRRQEILQEISAIESGAIEVRKEPSGLKKSGAKGRTLTLSSGHDFYVGRNAEENLKILRSAKAWDYWLHLRDYPGSHGILRRKKQDVIPDKVLFEALQFLMRHQFGAKAKTRSGDRFDCVITEVRFVKPIKGDRLGRVSYQGERTLRVEFKS